MSRFLTAAHGGVLPLSRRLVPTCAWASHHHLLQHQQQQVRHHETWPQWLRTNPTTLAEARAVYDACDAARIFADVRQRPITSSDLAAAGGSKVPDRDDAVAAVFRRTPGLGEESWAARGLDLPRAARVARRLRRMGAFRSEDGRGRGLKARGGGVTRRESIFASWAKWAEMAAAMGPPAEGAGYEVDLVEEKRKKEKEEREEKEEKDMARLAELKARAKDLKNRRKKKTEKVSDNEERPIKMAPAGEMRAGWDRATAGRSQATASREALEPHTLERIERRAARKLRHFEDALDREEGVVSKRRPILKKERDDPEGDDGGGGSRYGGGRHGSTKASAGRGGKKGGGAGRAGDEGRTEGRAPARGAYWS